MTTVASVVVTFHPDLTVLGRQIKQLKAQQTYIIVVDNGSNVDLLEWNQNHQCLIDEIILLGSNLGIAAAHNIGIQHAREQGFSHVLLMDQDSVPEPGMVETLWIQAEKHTCSAAIGPRYVDPRQDNPPPFLQIKGLKLVRHTCSDSTEALPVDYLISSGSLIPISTLDTVGGMREDLFIDYVDIEWGLRAKQMGFQSYGVCDARMLHSLGENPVKFFKRSIPIHSPLRHYYHFRNAILLYRSPWLPLNWKIVDGARLFLRYGFYTLFAKPRFMHWKMMSLGMFHGVLNRSGRYASSSD